MIMQRDNRRLAVASAAMMIVAALHTIGNISPPPEVAERLAPLREQMQRTVVPFGLGMTPSVWDIQRSLVFTMSVCLLTIGCLGMLVALDRDASNRLRRRIAGTAAAASAALTTIYGLYGIAPPFLMLSTVTLLFASAWGRHQQP